MTKKNRKTTKTEAATKSAAKSTAATAPAAEITTNGNAGGKPKGARTPTRLNWVEQGF